jgi:hypothetical protein
VTATPANSYSSSATRLATCCCVIVVGQRGVATERAAHTEASIRRLLIGRTDRGGEKLSLHPLSTRLPSGTTLVASGSAGPAAAVIQSCGLRLTVVVNAGIIGA